jgi:hypothetical protein
MMENLEQDLQSFTTTLENYHDSKWELGREAARIVGLYGKKSIGAIASVAVVCSETVRQWIRVWLAFKDNRSIEHPYSWHLAVVNRSKALGMDPIVLMNLAIAEGWNLREITDYQKDFTATPETRAFMHCDADIVIRAFLKDLGDKPVFCPFCKKEIGEFE